MAQKTLDGKIVLRTKRTGNKILVKTKDPETGASPVWTEMDFALYLKKSRLGRPSGKPPDEVKDENSQKTIRIHRNGPSPP